MFKNDTNCPSDALNMYGQSHTAQQNHQNCGSGLIPRRNHSVPHPHQLLF